MYKATVYENGDTYEYYTNATSSAIDLDIENFEELSKLMDIVLKSGHSIEIRQQ